MGSPMQFKDIFKRRIHCKFHKEFYLPFCFTALEKDIPIYAFMPQLPLISCISYLLAPNLFSSETNIKIWH